MFNGDTATVIYAALSAMSVEHSALRHLTYNAALNRTAYQSSVHTETVAGSYNASLANDGIRETDADKDDRARCSISHNEANPWWAVDLGRPTTIYRVDFTNRGDHPGMYLFSFVWSFTKFSYCYCLARKINSSAFDVILQLIDLKIACSYTTIVQLIVRNVQSKCAIDYVQLTADTHMYA